MLSLVRSSIYYLIISGVLTTYENDKKMVWSCLRKEIAVKISQMIHLFSLFRYSRYLPRARN